MENRCTVTIMDLKPGQIFYDSKDNMCMIVKDRCALEDEYETNMICMSRLLGFAMGTYFKPIRPLQSFTALSSFRIVTSHFSE